jgi:propanediol dehydratase large subunit
MTQKPVTIKVFESSRETLRLVSALRKEGHMETIEKLLNAEKRRLERKTLKKKSL